MRAAEVSNKKTKVKIKSGVLAGVFTIFIANMAAIVLSSGVLNELGYFLIVFVNITLSSWLMNHYGTFYRKNLLFTMTMYTLLAFLGYINYFFLKNDVVSLTVILMSIVPALAIDVEKDKILQSLLSLLTSTILAVALFLVAAMLTNSSRLVFTSISSLREAAASLMDKEFFIRLSALLPLITIYDLSLDLFVIAVLEEQTKLRPAFASLIYHAGYWLLFGLILLKMKFSLETTFILLFLTSLAKIMFYETFTIEKSYVHLFWGFPLFVAFLLSNLLRA